MSITIPAPGDVAVGKPPLERRAAVQADPVARWERMVEIRLAEEQIRTFHRDGQAWGTTHTADWQEAVAVGLAAATRPTDLVSCTHRTHHFGLALGVTLEALFAENIGRATGPLRGLGGSMHLTDVSVGLLHSFPIIGSQIPIAAGNAYAAQVQGTDSVSVAVFGDGASNIGAFHESLNLAAVWGLPVVFLCEHNGYAEYSNPAQTTSVTNIAERAAGYGMPSAIVDGQDVDAVRATIAEAVGRARRGDGPTLVEAKTYRWLGHSANDKAVYRIEGEADGWATRDPIDLAEQRLVADGALDAASAAAARTRIAEEVAQAAVVALASPEPTPADMFRFVHAQPKVEGGR